MLESKLLRMMEKIKIRELFLILDIVSLITMVYRRALYKMYKSVVYIAYKMRRRTIALFTYIKIARE